MIHYQYDPLGRRVGKATDSEQTHFLWDGDVLLQENKVDTQTQQDLNTRTYYFEPGTFKPVALREDNQVYHYHLDHLGTPDTLTNQEGEVVWSVAYKSYGNIALAYENQVEQPIRFQGQYFDEETGLHYNRFRYYDPQVGEFTQQDPIGLLGGSNNYMYTPNPLGWTDPLGLKCEEQKAQIHVAYRPNKPVGHNYIGITLPGEETQWFDLVMTESAGGVLGLIRGGQDTALRHGAKISKSTKISTREIDIDQARAALYKADEMSFQASTGPYNLLNNSCTSAVCDILKAGGINPPWWAKTPSLIHKWF
ncbi:RHS repeat domain-containing protein [Microbulbifer echini]|uniref:RHS repeat domain-containing protein n=1 Tax=Microbulbifer echini TaxID=1529067 RepID=A0ABV4NMH5_9GAMM